MSETMYSAEEAAQLLGLTVRTVRGYVRDGVLPGVRIGKQYRIARSDLDAFTAGRAARGGVGQGPALVAPATGAAHAAGQPDAGRVVAEASIVVKLAPISATALERLQRTLEAFEAAEAQNDSGALRVELLYDPQRATLKVVIVGLLALAGEVLRIIDALAEAA